MVQKDPPDEYEGIWVPIYCPRNRADCKSLSQIITTGHASFICCGEHNNGLIPQDRYRVCFKNPVIDDMTDYDERDITQTASVLIGAAAYIAEARQAGNELSPNIRVEAKFLNLTDK